MKLKKKFFNIINTLYYSKENISKYIKEYKEADALIECRNILEIIDEYKLNNIINIRILMSEEGLTYCVSEELPPECKRVAIQVSEKATQYHVINMLNKVNKEILDIIIDKYKDTKNNMCDDDDLLRDAVYYYTAARLSSYGPIYPLILDENVEEIAVDPPDYIVKAVARQTGPIWLKTNIKIGANEAEHIAVLLARRSGRDLSIAHPYTEGLLPEGHRLAATLGREVSRFGSSIVIRKHRSKPIGIPELIAQGVLSVELAAYLWLLVESKRSAIIVGPTASGKTTLLQAVLDFVPPWSRVVSVEDTPELNLSHHPNWDSLVTRLGIGEGSEDIDIYKLAKFSLRRRPDYLVIGEIRGEEARVLAYASSSGHASYSTMHADSAQTAVYRLLQEPFSVPKSLLSSIDAVVVITRTPGGRRVREVVELSYDAAADTISLVPVYSGGVLLSDSSTVLGKNYNEDTFREYNIEYIINEKINILKISRNREHMLSLVKKYYYEAMGVV